MSEITFLRERVLPKRKPKHLIEGELFGKRMAKFRKAAGYTQVDLAKELGVSQRVITYYEAETHHPPTHLLPVIAKALGVSTDQLLGVVKETEKNKPKDSRLKRRFTQVEKLPESEKKHVAQYLDRVIKAAKIKEEK
jgi:transcriptional regulator with XRE-family HTH domain